ncbi:MAG TPA: energy-coupling factor transporter ATPase [Clostridiales bacterium]|nr:energy-coupling factor transporter ATPase [Clostridiales bacterium]
MPIVIENLSYTYSPNTVFAHDALKNVHMTIDDGEFVGIIGHTGSGKSTLVLHLNGLIKLTSGKILVNDIDLSKKYDYKKLRSTVGIVFQYPEYQLFDETVEKDIAFGPKNLGLSKEEVAYRVRTAMEMVGLDYEIIKDRSPFELSGGQKRRAALAGVIAMHPKILILDEPTAGLDPKGKENILELVHSIKKASQVTVIMISHNMDEINEHCTRVAVLNQGELVYYLKPSELVERSLELGKMGLDIPTSARIARRLRKKGINIKTGIHKQDELIAEVLKLYKGERA